MKSEQRKVVYVVDDDPSFRNAMRRMMTAAGFDVRSYASPTELLAHLSGKGTKERAGCVLADLRMPGLDGLQLQQACAAAGVGLPKERLIFSTNASRRILARIGGAGP